MPRDAFRSLTPEEQKKEIERTRNEAFDTKERVEMYVSPEEIILGLNTVGIKRLREEYRNIQIDDYGKAKTGDIGFDVSNPVSGGVLAELACADIPAETKEAITKLKQLFGGHPIVDLGAGKRNFGYYIASILGAKGYVGVEPHNWKGLQNNLIVPQKEGNEEIAAAMKNAKPIPFAVVPEDALTFLKRLPDHSVGIIAIGTDKWVITSRNFSLTDEDKRKSENEYISAVNKEIARVTHPLSGVLVGYRSVFKGENFSTSDTLKIGWEADIYIPKK